MTDNAAFDYTKNHPDYPAVRREVESHHRITVQDLIEWCLRRELDPAQTYISAVTVIFYRPESETERARREEYEAANRERTERWEREMLARLRAKYEGRVDD
jgi:hypothetical protein